MLINLSNHPFEKWDEKQKQAALTQFGNVEDFLFPIVSPESDLSDIENQADKIFKEITGRYRVNICIHLMGEFVLCYQLSKRFEKARIPCFASTTLREVAMRPNGEKISLFHFIKFRKYFDYEKEF